MSLLVPIDDTHTINIPCQICSLYPHIDLDDFGLNGWICAMCINATITYVSDHILHHTDSDLDENEMAIFTSISSSNIKNHHEHEEADNVEDKYDDI